jgi:hypothetical protein
MTTFAIFITMHAGPWKVTHLGIGKRFSISDLIKLHPGNVSLLVGFIRPYRDIIFRCACYNAGPATGAFIQVNNHPEFVSVSQNIFHHLPRHHAFIILTGVFHHTE